MSIINDFLPFFGLNDDDFMRYIDDVHVLAPDNVDYTLSIDDINKITFRNFSYNDNFLNNTDPDLNHYQYCNIDNSCEYIYENDLNVFTDKFDVHSLLIASHNIASLPHNFDNFSYIMNDRLKHKLDIMGLCETKLTDDLTDLYNIPGFNMFYNNKSRNSGGLMLYINDNFSSFKRNDLECRFDYIETLFVELSINDKNVLVGQIYRRPGSNFNDFLEKLNDLLVHISTENKTCYLVGDFNVDISKNLDVNNVTQFVSLLSSENMFCSITKPTRVTGHSATIIDHIWSNNVFNHLKSAILLSNISDHYPVISVFQLEKSPSQVNDSKSYYRNFSQSNMLNFKLALEDVDWTLVMRARYAQVAFKNFSTIFLPIFNKYFPLLESKQIKKKNKSYMTNEILDLITQKNSLQKKFYKYPLTYGHEYRRIRNRVTLEIKKLKRSYYKSSLENSNGNPKKTWGIINEVLGRNRVKVGISEVVVDGDSINDKTSIAQSFNDYFSGIASSLASKIPPVQTDPLNYVHNHNGIRFEFKILSRSDVRDVIINLNNSAAGIDDIQPKIIKFVVDEILDVITYICNLSFKDGLFPSELKLAKISPIFKSGAKTDISNYRPISVLPAISKILEKLANSQLNEYLDRNNITNNNQYGFRKFRSTESALVHFNNDVVRALDNNNYLVAVFLDFSKAFDTVVHSILLDKLKYYGIEDVSLSWFTSYLTCRKQCVVIDRNFYSDFKDITYSVPQGSILGPTLFNLYINDLCNCLKHSKSVLYADDSVIYSEGHDINELVNNINSDLNEISKWLMSNKLTLNLTKSHYIVFTKKNANNLHVFPNVKINNNDILRVSETRFLGVIFTCNLNWRKHIDTITSKLNKQNSILFLIRNKLTKCCLRLIYFSLVYPYLIYCNVIWGNTFYSSLKSMIIVHKKIIRTMSFAKRFDHTDPLYTQYNILSYDKLHIYCKAIFVYKNLNNLITYNLYSRSAYDNFGLRNSMDLQPSFMRTEMGQRSISYNGCLVWNNLSREIQLSESLPIFKRRLRLMLLNSNIYDISN